LLALRDAMPAAERARASVAICDAANALLAQRLPAGATVALYAAKGSEVDTARVDAFVRGQGFGVAYPRVIGDGRLLGFHAVTLDELAPSRFGLREPSADAPAVGVADIAAFAVPGLAFDREGGRIGWGRGHYDATFAAAPPSALRIGLAYECQMVEQVAREPHDVALHIIITEVATHLVA
jgi:5-formyltetrahydrofolate cyclo-ligase